MRKLSFIFVCLLLAVLIAITGCSFNPAGDSSQETEETQPGTPSDTPEENPENTPSEDNPSTAPGEDDTPSGGGDNSDKPNSPTFTRDEQERILDLNFEATMLAINEWVRSEGYADIPTPTVPYVVPPPSVAPFNSNDNSYCPISKGVQE